MLPPRPRAACRTRPDRRGGRAVGGRAENLARCARARRGDVEGPFVDIGDTTSLATLRTALAASAIHYGLDEIDAATIRLRAPRAFTQQVSRCVYEQGSFAGIRYRSRLGDDLLNWAIFEPGADGRSPLAGTSSARIEADDPDPRAAFELLGLTLG